MIYIVRHGETEWNKKGLTQGHSNIELNEVGIKQAQLLKDKFKNIHFDKVFSSPLKRAIQTAKTITSENIIIDNRLIERNNGLFEGKTKEEVVTIKNNSNFNEGDYGIESIESLQKRADEFISEILSKYKGKNILIVTHGGLIINIRAYLEGPTTNIKNYILDNCEVYTFPN